MSRFERSRSVSRLILGLSVALILHACISTPSGLIAVLSVSPPSLSLVVGETQRVSAEIPGSFAVPSFSSTKTTVATVSEDGLVTAVSPGKATIIVSAEGLTAQVPVEVTAPAASVGVGGVTSEGTR